MKTLTHSDNIERFQTPDQRMQVESFAARIGTLDMVLTRILPMGMNAVESHQKRVLGGASMNGQRMFNPRQTQASIRPAPETSTAFDQVAQVGDYAPLEAADDVVLWTDLPTDKVESAPAPKAEYRAFTDPIDALKEVDPNATEKLDTETARQKVEMAHQNGQESPELRLPL